MAAVPFLIDPHIGPPRLDLLDLLDLFLDDPRAGIIYIYIYIM